jgi:small subunit ribosomal protein S17e
VDRIKRLSFEVLDVHKSKFGEDFVENKKALNQVSIIRSKGLKNKVAGYITRFIKKQIREEKLKQDRSSDSSNIVEQESSLEITESEEISEVEEITLTNEKVEEITLTNKKTETTTPTTESVEEKTETTTPTTESVEEKTETTTPTTESVEEKTE